MATTGKPAAGAKQVVVRDLRSGDLAAVVRIDAKITGRERGEYFERKMTEVLRDSGVRISLAAELDGACVGFLIGRLYCGEFGLPETVATVDTIGVDPELGGHGVGTALFSQLEVNLRAFGIERLQTQVDWQYQDLIRFLAMRGFRPAPVLSLEKRL